MNKTVYRQADSRWGSLPYPTKAYSFAHNGCGCCAVTHCAIEIDKYKNYTPADVRKYMVQFATKGHGTTWNGITKGLQNYGYNVHWKQSDTMNDIYKVLKTSLKRGVLLMGSSLAGSKRVRWTSGGHYVAFVNAKYESNDWWFYIKDSGGRYKDGKRDGWFSYKQHLAGDIRNVWICTSLKASSTTTTTTTTKRAKGTYTGLIATPTIKKGSEGGKVRTLQKFLDWYGGYDLSVDGVFGSKSVSALKKFQKAEGLKADGIYGKASHKVAYSYKKKLTNPAKCIDVSYWQGKTSVENWKKVKNTCDYAICRASYTSQSKFSLNRDSTFVTNFRNAQTAGLKVGAYHYSQAITVAEAKKEAEYLCDILKTFDVDFYVVCDYEFGKRLNSKTASKASEVANAFCDVVKGHGYKPCIYANTSTLNNYLTNPKHPVWVAQYASSCTYKGEKVMWQYTSSGSVPGISGKVDLSYVY